MTQLFALVSPVLQAAPDTGVTRVVLDSGWLSNVASVGQVVVSVLVTIMLVMIVLMLFALKKSLDELTKMIKSAYEPVRGVLGEAREITNEVKKLTQSVQAPVARIVGTVDDASERVHGFIVRVEERLERLDELAGIVQEGAEGFVVKSASLARGVRVGGAALRAAFFSKRNEGKKYSKRRREALAPAREGRATRADLAEDESAQIPENVGPRIRPRTLPAP
ncbi:MAG: DUF948 domain-containing protein [Gemmatimonadaceae bacterium]